MKEPVILEIAGCPIEIVFNPVQKQKTVTAIRKFFSEFEVKRKKIDYRLEFSDNTGESSGKTNIFRIPIDCNFNAAVKYIQRIVRLHIKDNGFVLHASACLLKKRRAAVFVGSSGAGKSTISGLLDGYFRKICDDQCIIIIKNRKAKLYQSFVREKNEVNKSPEGYRLATVFFIRKSSEIKIIKIDDPAEKFLKLFKQVWIERQYREIQYANLFSLAENIPGYYLYFTREKNNLVKFFSGFARY